MAKNFFPSPQRKNNPQPKPFKATTGKTKMVHVGKPIRAAKPVNFEKSFSGNAGGPKMLHTHIAKIGKSGGITANDTP
jgi:hypothetical protein